MKYMIYCVLVCAAFFSAQNLFADKANSIQLVQQDRLEKLEQLIDG